MCCCLRLHHIVSDGWSMEVLTREVSALYAAYAAEQSHRRLSCRSSMRTMQCGSRVVAGRGVGGATGILAPTVGWCTGSAGAPTDRPRPVIQSHRGASLSLQLPAELTASLKQLSQREGVRCS